MKATATALEKCNCEQAFQCMDTLRRIGVPPDVNVYNTLIAACKRAGNTSSALQLLDEMKKGNVRPNTCTYNTLISACGKAGLPSAALSLLAEMKMTGVPRDTRTYNTAISGCAAHGLIDTAIELFSIDMSTEGLPRDVVTYNSLILAYMKCNRRQDAEHVLKAMKENGIQPNGITYNILISGRVAANEMAEALALLQSAVEDGTYKPSLGLREDDTILDFHVNVVCVRPADSAHHPAVAAEVAKALLEHHFNAGRIKPGLCVVVGRHGDGTIRNEITKYLDERGVNWEYDRFSGGELCGGAVFIMPPANRPALNARAPEFVPGY